jgi:hypothetical protein
MRVEGSKLLHDFGSDVSKGEGLQAVDVIISCF